MSTHAGEGDAGVLWTVTAGTGLLSLRRGPGDSAGGGCRGLCWQGAEADWAPQGRACTAELESWRKLGGS